MQMAETKLYTNLTGTAGNRIVKNLLVLMCAFFVCILIAAACAQWLAGYFEPASRSQYLAQSVAQNIIGFCGAAVFSAWFISRRPARFLALTHKVSWRPFAGVLTVYAIGLPFLNQTIYYNQQMELPAIFSGIEEYMKTMEAINGKITEIILSTNTVGGLISGILIVGILTGFSEEVLFRGSLQRILTYKKGFGVWAIWIAAFIFSAVHLQFYGFIPRLLLGAFFGYILYSTGSLWPGVFAHALNNSIVIVSSWIDGRNGTSSVNADMWGVAETGFPTYAAISLIALALFFRYAYPYFFKNKESNNIETPADAS